MKWPSAFPRLLPAIGMGLGIAACHGIGRWCYALLLPAMREDLHWGYLLASWMNTSNAIGYIGGAVSGYVLLRYVNTGKLFLAGMWITVVSVLLTGLSGDFTWLFAMRLAAGIGTAWTFSCGGTIVTQRYAADAQLRGLATGVFFATAGIGMVVVALVAPAMLHAAGNGAWPSAWIALGAVSVALCIWPSMAAVRAGEVQAAIPTGQLQFAGTKAVVLAYFFFAVSHTAYIFFVFAWLRSQPVDWRLGPFMWVVLGLAIFASPFLWQRALNGWPAAMTVAASSLATGIGSALPLLHLDAGTVVLSALLVGSSAFITPSAMAVLARQELPPAIWGKALMFYTVTFSVGQAVGSWGTGWLAERYSLDASLGAGGLGLVIGAAIALLAGRRSAALEAAR